MGLMDTIRARARIHTSGDHEAERRDATNVRSTNWYESVSGDESNSYQFVLRKETTPPIHESEYKTNERREGKSFADDPPPYDAPSDIIPVVRTTDWYESEAEVAVATLRYWYGMGVLDTLPERIPGFAGELVQYSDRARLIGLVKAILDSVPWSLTARDRAVQFVVVLTPLIEGGAA